MPRRLLLVFALAGCPGRPVPAEAPAEPVTVVEAPPDAAPPPDAIPPDAAPPPDADLGLRVGDEIPLSAKIKFEIGKATIRRESFPVLDELAAFLAAHPSLTLVEIEGHEAAGDSDGHHARKPTEDRADAVLEYLVQKGGIAAKRLVAKGYGESRPLVSNKTEEGRRKNRRIEVRIREIR